jgi:methyl-accepting chemotaxis protein
MFDNIKIGVKITGCFAAIFIFVTWMMLYGAHVRKNVVHDIDSLYSQHLGSIKEIGELKSSVKKIQEDVYRYVGVPAERNKMLASIKQETNSVNQIIQVYKSRNLTTEEKKLISEFEGAWPVMQRGYQDAMNLADDGKNNEVNRLLSDGSYVAEASKKTLYAVRNLNVYNTSRNEAAIKSIVKANGGWSAQLLLLSVFGAIFLAGIAIILTQSITNPLKRGVVMMRELGRGHISKRLHIVRKDEIGELVDAMNQFADHLQKNVVFNMQQISEGNINIKPSIIDEKDEIGPALDKMVKAIGSMSNEVGKCFIAARDGDLINRADITTYHGEFRKIVSGFNDTLDAMLEPINEAAVVLVKMAKKDLSDRIKGDYKGYYNEIKRTINAVARNLDKALQQVAIGAEQVASASTQVSTGGQSLSQGASEQASSLEEISSSLQEMSSMTKLNAINARDARGVADAARGSADKGVESMTRMSEAINRIKSSSDSTARIVKTIDEIAFQTRLLALNAAVEAARAGDAGKSFAVVAEEVKNLAMRSAEAAKNTANLIEEAVKNSENGVNINSEVLKNFQDIAEKANTVSQVVAEIAVASEQQDEGISQVNKAVEQLNLLTQQNAANSEELASAAQEMSSQSGEMRSMVDNFKLSDSGDFNKTPLLSNPGTQGKGVKSISGLHPDPRKVIPLDDKDHDVMKTIGSVLQAL